MSNTEQGFMYDICRNPHDHAIKLIFADWLEDNGQKLRAEFIRVQHKIETEFTAYEVNFIREQKYNPDQLNKKFKEIYRLHKREMQILWEAHDTLNCCMWEAWCYAKTRNERGEPTCEDGSNALAITPHSFPGLEGNSCGCQVPFGWLSARQKFCWGFVSKIEISTQMLNELPKIIVNQPIIQVKLKYKHPQKKETADKKQTRYSWWRSYDDAAYTVAMTTGRMGRITLPINIFERLKNYTPQKISGLVKDYPTEELAIEDLSQTLLEMAWESVNEEWSSWSI